MELVEQGPVPHPAPDFLLRLAPAAAFVVPPWSQHFVARCGRNSFLGGSQQLSFDQPADRRLRGTLRHSDALGNLPIAGLDDMSFSLLFSLLPGKPQIDEEAYDAAVMADEVAHQDFNYVVVERNHAIPTVNIALNRRLHLPTGFSILRRLHYSYSLVLKETENDSWYQICLRSDSRSGSRLEVLHRKTQLPRND